MVRPILPVLCALTLISACKVEYDPYDLEGAVAVTPPILDFQAIPAGETATGQAQVDLLRGAGADVKNVWIDGPDADVFSLLGQPFPGRVEDGVPLVIDVLYAPEVAGWHQATLHVLHDAGDGKEQFEATIAVRGHALVPEILVVPWSVDFGPVGWYATGQRQVTIENVGDVDVTLDRADFSHPDFATTTPFPLPVPARSERVVTLIYTATTDQTAYGSVAFYTGDLSVDVRLSANDCEHGDPDLYDQDGDGYTSCGGDCDETRDDVNPAAIEVADLADQDCDGVVDEGTAFADDDGDGYCEGPICVGGATPGDCSDGQAAVNPGAVEVMDNGVDDDCDGVVDQGTLDVDGDGYAPSGGDCDDARAAVHPGATELGDWLDNDCDGVIDEGTLLYDDDGDGFCEGPVCSDGTSPGDCDDRVLTGVATHPAATELADWSDNDCDGTVDEGTENRDDDGDGFAEIGGDCDDADPAINPATGAACAP